MTTQEKLIELCARMQKRVQTAEADKGKHPDEKYSEAHNDGCLYAYKDALKLITEYFPHLDLPAVPPVFVNPNA